MTPNDPPPPGPPPRRRAGELEAQIITVLVEARGPLTTAEVLERLGPDGRLSYSTVVTTLTRLHQKGAVVRRRHGRAFRYMAIADAAGLTASRMSRLLSDEPDRASVLRRFVSTLDSNDEEILRELLREQD